MRRRTTLPTTRGPTEKAGTTRTSKAVDRLYVLAPGIARSIEQVAVTAPERAAGLDSIAAVAPELVSRTKSRAHVLVGPETILNAFSTTVEIACRAKAPGKVDEVAAISA